jgi:hypothetical protein
VTTGQAWFEAPALVIDHHDAAYMQGFRNACRDVLRKLGAEVDDENNVELPRMFVELATERA